MPLNVPNQGPYQASISDRSRTMSPMSDNWIVYPSRSPTLLDNLWNPQTENTKNENVACCDISLMYSRSNNTASTDSGPRWVSSAQWYGWNIDEAIREDVCGEYESLAIHEHYGNDDGYLDDYPQQNGLYDDTECDVGDEPINIYLDDRLNDDDDLKDENEEPATQLLNPLALNPPTLLASRSNLHEDTMSKPLNGRHALTDIPNLSPSPNLRSDSPPPGDSPEKKTGCYYGELESNPSISIWGDCDVSEQSVPLRKKSKLQKKNCKSRKMKSYNTLRQDEHADKEDIDNEASPAIPKDTNENDRRGHVVSNSSADIHNNAGPASAGLALLETTLPDSVLEWDITAMSVERWLKRAGVARWLMLDDQELSTSIRNLFVQLDGNGLLEYKTPADINQLEAQKKQINHLQNHQVSPSTMQEAMGRVIRGAEMTMQNAILLQHEVHQLRMENRHQRQRRAAPRAFTQTGGSLTGAKGLQKALEQEAIVEEAHQPVSRLHKPPTCSTCGKIGHNRLKCPEK